MLAVTLPNLLSASRLILAPFMFWAVLDSHWIIAVTILWIAIITDISDGYLARRAGSASPLGGLLDHGSDAFFVTCTIAALSTQGWAPLPLAFMIPIAFLQYMLDSRALAGRPLRASFIGRYNGIAYFVFAGWPVMQKVLNLTPVPFEWFNFIGWGLVMTTAISIVDRLVTLMTGPPENS